MFLFNRWMFHCQVRNGDGSRPIIVIFGIYLVYSCGISIHWPTLWYLDPQPANGGRVPGSNESTAHGAARRCRMGREWGLLVRREGGADEHWSHRIRCGSEEIIPTLFRHADTICIYIYILYIYNYIYIYIIYIYNYIYIYTWKLWALWCEKGPPRPPLILFHHWSVCVCVTLFFKPVLLPDFIPGSVCSLPGLTM